MRKALSVLFLLVSVLPDLSGAEHWIRLSTPHFEMYTTNNVKQATAALKVFEQVRYFFLQNSHSKTVPDTPVRIIAFRSEKEYQPYRYNEGAFAYYLRSRQMDYIVMQDISPEHYQAAMHEYTHLIVEHLGMKLPVWLNEGLADVFSTLEARGNQALVGRPLEGRIVSLMNQRWLDLNALFAVGQDSPYYNESEKMSVFYSESWALTHMLDLGNGYNSGFSRFLTAINAGHPAAEALQSAYGKSLAQVDQDLHAYIKQTSMRGAIFDIKLDKAELEAEASEPSELAVDLALAELLASQRKSGAEALDRLTKLAASHPESAEAQESLGYLEWMQGGRAKAESHFKAALEKGSKNPEMLFQYSLLLHESGAPAEQILPVLRKAVEFKPGYSDAWFNLGMTALNAGAPGEALTAFSHLKSVTPDRAFSFFSAQAYCYMRLNAFAQAHAQAEKAMQYAQTADQKFQAANLQRQLDSLEHQGAAPAVSASSAQAPGPAQTEAPERPVLARRPNGELPRDVPSIHVPGQLLHLETTLKSLDCNAKNRRLHVIANAREMVFEFDEPDAVIIRNTATKEGSIEMTCGPQKPVKVGIFYMLPAKPGPADGMIREMVF
jgi:tetratricopeptide (TPR) repeat protein